MKILLLTKDYRVCDVAIGITKQYFRDETYVVRNIPDPLLQEELMWGNWDWVISFLSPWIVPRSLLYRTPGPTHALMKGGAINFHPAPPAYRGLGGYNFALYDGAESYGVTCHWMEEEVDSGEVIRVQTFPILPQDTVASLIEKSYAYLLQLYLEVIQTIAIKGVLYKSPPHRDHSVTASPKPQWVGKPRTRKEMNALQRITPDMDREEINRRVRATNYKQWKPFIELCGHRFEWAGQTETALAEEQVSRQFWDKYNKEIESM